jgi:hypothetical protein
VKNGLCPCCFSRITRAKWLSGTQGHRNTALPSKLDPFLVIGCYYSPISNACLVL